MSDFIIRVATAEDLPQIVALANQYTYQNLLEEERQAGFLTGSFSEAAMRSMLLSAPSMVAYNQADLAGFIINSKMPAPQYPALVQEIIKLLPALTYSGKPLNQYNYFFYGPVLVAKNYRQKNLLARMFQLNKAQLIPTYNLGIAFIDQANKASLLAHTKLGLKIVGELITNTHTLHILVFPLNEIA